MSENNWKRVSKKSAKICRQRAIILLKDVQEDLKNKFKFNFKLVGSGSWYTIIKNKEGFFDLDYQIILTKNSKEKLSDATNIKNEFFKAFKKNIKNTIENIEDSTTAITIVDDSHKFSIDFVIIKTTHEGSFIIKRKNEDYRNLCVWNKLKISCYNLYDFFNNLSFFDKQFIIEKMVIPQKIIEKSKDEKKQITCSSYEIFLSKINEYKISIENNSIKTLKKTYKN